MKNILRRFARTLVGFAIFTPIQSLLCIATGFLGVMGIKGFLAFQNHPWADTVTPLVFAFGIWPFIAMLATAAVLGARSYFRVRFWLHVSDLADQKKIGRA